MDALETKNFISFFFEHIFFLFTLFVWIELILIKFNYRRFSVPQRQASLDDINLDQFLRISNYEDTVKQLDIYYGIGNYVFCLY